MISNDLLAQVAGGLKPAQPAPPGPAEEVVQTQRLDPERTQQLEAQKQQLEAKRKSAPDGDKTVQIAPLDPDWRPPQPEVAAAPAASSPPAASFNPDDTQKLEPGDTQKLEAQKADKDASVTQRLDDSIARLREAKRLLQNQ